METCVQKMADLKSEWNSDLSASEMEDMVKKMDELIHDHRDLQQQAQAQAGYDGTSPAVVKARKNKVKQSQKLVKTKYQKFLRKMKKTLNSKLISMGDRRGFDNQENENEDAITNAVKDVNKADEVGKAAYEDILKQKETIMGFNNHLGNVNTSIALSERYLRMMRDRDKRHRCYVFLMIFGMLFTIACGGAVIWGT